VVGHTDRAFTLATYTHLMPSSDERTKSAIASVYGRRPGADSDDPTTRRRPRTRPPAHSCWSACHRNDHRSTHAQIEFLGGRRDRALSRRRAVGGERDGAAVTGEGLEGLMHGELVLPQVFGQDDGVLDG
jgi:hypothetical protein